MKYDGEIAIPISHNDIEFIKRILPAHYKVEQSNESSVNTLAIRCTSEKGIRNEIDAEDHEHWGYIMGALKYKFGSRSFHVYPNACSFHTDFTIYVRSEYIIV